MSRKTILYLPLLLLPLIFVSYQNCLPSGGGGAGGGAGGGGTTVPQGKTSYACDISGEEAIGGLALTSITSNSKPWTDLESGQEGVKLDECRQAAVNSILQLCQSGNSIVNISYRFKTKSAAGSENAFTHTYFDACHIGLPSGTCANPGGLLESEVCQSPSECCSNDCPIAGSFGTCAGPTLPVVGNCTVTGDHCEASSCCAGDTCVTSGGKKTCVPSGYVKYSLSIQKNGQGTVVSTPNGINCGSACASSFDANSTVELTATAAPGYGFSGWSSNCGNTNPTTVTLATQNNCIATFTPLPTYTLSVVRSGSGTITSNPAGILCNGSGGPCSASFYQGQTVTLTGTPASYFSNATWSGDCATNADGTANVVLSGNKSCTGTFNQSHYSLQVTVNPSNAGTVTSSPAGISCTSSCSAMMPKNQVVTIGKTPASGYIFSSYSGDCSGGSVTMSANKTCTVNFSKDEIEMYIGVVGKGRVSGSPGIDAYSNKTMYFPRNQAISMSATGSSGYVFEEWSGTGCTYSTSTISFTLTSYKSCIAYFCKPNGASCTYSDYCCVGSCYSGRCQ